MSLISSAISNMFNGVSQQPDSMRAANQCTELLNAYPSIATGVRKRPPLTHIAKLSDTSDADAHVHEIIRDASERYVTRFTTTGLEVWDISGNQVAVNTPDGVGYLDCTDPKTELAMVTIADYTFVLNKTVVTQMDAEYSDSAKATITINSVPANTVGNDPTYLGYIRVTVNGVNYDEAYTPAKTTTDYATNLKTAIDAAIGASYTVTSVGNQIFIETPTPPQDLTVDAYAVDEIRYFGIPGWVYTTSTNRARVSVGVAASSAPSSYQTFADLPASPSLNDTYKIIGDELNNFDNYYVVWNGSAWEETRIGGLNNSLDASTLPHVLIRQADGTFSFEQAEWGERLVGDSESNPVPSFIGRSINDVFLHRNRLGLLSDESCVLSRAGEYFNMWHETVTDLLDSDPIDISASHTKVALLRNAVSFAKNLLIFSDTTQFFLTGGDTLTPATARLEPVTEFESDGLVRPISNGQTVYFPVTKNGHVGVREYYVDEDTVSNDASDITAHVPSYLQGAAYDIAASSQTDLLTVLTTTQSSKAFIYKYYWGEDRKVQSSWSTWVFPSEVTVMKMFHLGETIYVVHDCADGLFLESIDLQDGVTDTSVGFLIHLDRKVELTGVYDAGNNWTTWTLPYSRAGDDMTVVLNGDWGVDAGKALTPTRPTTSTVRVSGDYSTHDCFVGANYSKEYTFSEQYVRDSDNSVIAGGKLQMLWMTVLFEDTGYFRAEVTPVGRDTATAVFAGKILGVSQTVLGEPAIATGTFRFPVMSNSADVTIKLVNDTHMPSRWQSAEWEAQYILRTRRG